MRRNGGGGGGGFGPPSSLNSLHKFYQLLIKLKRVCKHFFSSNDCYMNQDSTRQIFERVLLYIIVFEVKNQLTLICPVTKLL